MYDGNSNGHFVQTSFQERIASSESMAIRHGIVMEMVRHGDSCSGLEEMFMDSGLPFNFIYHKKHIRSCLAEFPAACDYVSNTAPRAAQNGVKRVRDPRLKHVALILQKVRHQGRQQSIPSGSSLHPSVHALKDDRRAFSFNGGGSDSHSDPSNGKHTADRRPCNGEKPESHRHSANRRESVTFHLRAQFPEMGGIGAGFPQTQAVSWMPLKSANDMRPPLFAMPEICR